MGFGDLLARISRSLGDKEFLYSRSLNGHHQGKKAPFHFPNLHALRLTTQR